jgi:hypothetical protein
MERLTWGQLIKIEPELEALRQYAASVKDPGDTPSFCANAIWYGHNRTDRYRGAGIRGRVIVLVGWYASGADPRLQTQAAYDLAYDTIYNELPGCRGCLCL